VTEYSGKNEPPESFQCLASLSLVCDGVENAVLYLLHDASLNLIYGSHRSFVIPVSIWGEGAPARSGIFMSDHCGFGIGRGQNVDLVIVGMGEQRTPL